MLAVVRVFRRFHRLGYDEKRAVLAVVRPRIYVRAGDGRGIIMTGQYGYTPAPSYHDDRLRGTEDGYLYHVIANGVRSMPGYAQQITVADRWAIVAYIRALQRSQNASAADVPAGDRAAIEQARSANMGGGSQGAATPGATTPGASSGSAPAAGTSAN